MSTNVLPLLSKSLCFMHFILSLRGLIKLRKPPGSTTACGCSDGYNSHSTVTLKSVLTLSQRYTPIYIIASGKHSINCHHCPSLSALIVRQCLRSKPTSGALSLLFVNVNCNTGTTISIPTGGGTVSIAIVVQVTVYAE